MVLVKALLWRLTLFTALWGVLAGHSLTGWSIGAVGIVAATWVSMTLRGPSSMPIKVLPWMRFVLFFLWNSIQGGFDVARRVLRPRISIRPTMVEYLTQLPDGSARTLFLNTLSLLPGTLSVRTKGQWVMVHSLEDSDATQTALAALEARVAQLFRGSMS